MSWGQRTWQVETLDREGAPLCSSWVVSHSRFCLWCKLAHGNRDNWVGKGGGVIVAMCFKRGHRAYPLGTSSDPWGTEPKTRGSPFLSRLLNSSDSPNKIPNHILPEPPSSLVYVGWSFQYLSNMAWMVYKVKPMLGFIYYICDSPFIQRDLEYESPVPELVFSWY